MMQLVTQRPGIDHLLRVDPSRRAAGDVANVVGLSVARGQPEFIDRDQNADRIGSADFANLQVGTGSNIEITDAEALGDGGEFPVPWNADRMPPGNRTQSTKKFWFGAT